MITDSYTREYDERQQKQAAMAKIDRLSRAISKLCLEYTMEMDGDIVRVTVTLPFGGQLKEFSSIEEAIAWAEYPFSN